MAQTTLNPKYNNKTLFSNYYLDNKVKTITEWKKNDHIAAFSEIKEIYEKERKSFENFNEAQLIKHFLDPVFKSLFFESEVEEAAGSEFPDYAFFRDKTSRDEAHKNKGTISFYTNALAIGEVKKWDKELDGKPIHQLRNYLDVTEKKWGILTNGRKWRLFCKEKKRDEYYEIDLPSLLDNNDLEGFKYFFYFFRRDAFLLPENFLEQVLRESEDHAKAIGNNLKENVYKAMKKIADGFFGRPQNNLDRNNEAAQELVQKNTMLLLYRLLFLLYAEDRNLLDVTNSKYLNNHSFRRIKKEVEEKRGRIEQGYDYSGTTIWDRLKSLFELINVGSEAIGEKEFHVPAYNGGLFDTAKNPELEKWKIGDKYLAEAIRLLTWSDVNGAGGFVDYSELEIRHLGSIYEGLLEYKLKVAESDIVTKENEWVSLEKYNEGRKQKKVFDDFDEFSRTRKGELYLATDKGERKATGSYYTPDYIVNYIVKNTVGPVVDEKWKDAEAKKQSFVDATLSVKVLDPAMGSGHFLVGAVEFLAEKLLKAAQKDIEAGRMTDESRFSDQDWARREVVAHCIYGVDLNPMAVELAKVGLWLTTISKMKPLSFLDHRLKQGNSLIGARLIDLPWYPDLKVKKEKKDETVLKKFEEEVHKPFVDKIVDQLKQLSEIDDDTIEHVRQKKELFEKLKENKQYLQIKSIADVYTAVYFGNETTEVNKNPKFAYNDLFWALKGDDKEWSRKTYKPWFKKAMEIAEDKSFFHWELEFPEIFFEGGAPKENPGWDAVVGNPPYVRSEQLKPNKEYFRFTYDSYHTAADLYIYFFERGHKLLKNNGEFGFISSNKFIRSAYGQPLRQLLIKNANLKQIIDFGELPVFPEAATFPAIFLTTKGESKQKQTIFAQICSLDFQSLEATVNAVSEKLPPSAFSGNNWSLGKEEGNSILRKMDSIGEHLGNYVKGNIRFGVKTGFNKAFIIDSATRIKLIAEDSVNIEIIKPIIVGDDVRKYEINFKDKYLIWTYIGVNIEKYPYIKKYLEQYREQLEKRSDKGNFWYELRPCEYYSDFQKPKIVYPDIAMTCRFCLDRDGYFVEATCFEIPIDDLYLVSILNSKLIFSYIRSLTPVLGDSNQGGRLRFKTVYLKALPIRRISFTTPPARRAALFEEAKALYSAEAPDSVKKLLDFVGARLDAKPEESDVVHDLLAHLAERMIEINKEKNAEIKGFLDFLKGEIGVSIEDLSNKTAIQEYYSHEFQNLIDVLAKNKKKLKAGYDPKSPSRYKILQQWYNDSTGKLKPLMGRIKATDGLIDQIVYKLYGLTADEIKIVEESIKTTTTKNTSEGS